MKNTRYEQLSDKFYRVFFIDSLVERQVDGSWQLQSGIAYLTPDLPKSLELFDGKGRSIGRVVIAAAVTKKIQLALATVNTVFKFSPNEKSEPI